MSYDTNDPSNNLKEKINRDVISVTIEKVLVDISPATYRKVITTLSEEHKSTVPDFYEHPEFLKKVLKDLYGECHTEILKKIKTELQRYVLDKEISDFIAHIDE